MPVHFSAQLLEQLRLITGVRGEIQLWKMNQKSTCALYCFDAIKFRQCVYNFTASDNITVQGTTHTVMISVLLSYVFPTLFVHASVAVSWMCACKDDMSFSACVQEWVYR